MRSHFIAAVALSLSSSAFAQMPVKPMVGAVEKTAQPVAPDMLQSPPMADTAGATSQTKQMATPTAAPPTAPTNDAASTIAAEFPAYDKDNSGALDRSEFDGWMTALRSKTVAAASDPAKSASWLKDAFKAADTDQNKMVSLAELTTFLTAKG